MSVAARVADVRARIAVAATGAGRDPAAVTLVAATKTVAVADVVAVVAAGVPDVGENRAQELVRKAPDVSRDAPRARWHFLGPLQRNKIRGLAPLVACWQSVDRLPVGALIARHAPGARVFVEVNLAAEPQKPGCRPDETVPLVAALRDRGLVVAGLMTVPPVGDDPRPWFGRLRSLGADAAVADLSMGMSDDFEAAVAEGATVVRVGRALFGLRPHPQAPQQ